MFHALCVGVQSKDVATFTQQMNQVTSISAAGIEDAHSCCDISSQNLIEYININLSELFLHTKRHKATSLVSSSFTNLSTGVNSAEQVEVDRQAAAIAIVVAAARRYLHSAISCPVHVHDTVARATA